MTANDSHQPTEEPTDEMTLEELRAEIEDIDRELVEIIARRTYVADAIAQVKAEEDLPTTDEEQEARVVERVERFARRFEVDPEYVTEVFQLLIELNKVHQRSTRD